MKLSLPTQVLEYKFNLPTKTLHHQVLQGKFNLHQNLAPLTYTKTWHQVLGEKSKFWHRQDLEGKFTQRDNLKLGLSKFWSCLGGGARRLVHNRLKPPSVELSLHSEHILFQMCYSLVWPRWLIRWLVFTLSLTYSHVDWCSLTSLHFTPPDFIASWKFKLFPQYLAYAYCICRCLLLNSWTRKATAAWLEQLLFPNLLSETFGDLGPQALDQRWWHRDGGRRTLGSNSKGRWQGCVNSLNS